MTFRVLIVGLGAVAMGYDLGRDDPGLVLTHARAFSLHPDFTLLGGVDPDPARRALFEDRYGAPAHGDLAVALDGPPSPDVVVIASPTHDHGAAVHTVLARCTPRLILCEKPLSYDRAEARAVIEGCRARGVALYVNYLRRVEPGVREVGRRIAEGAIETPVRGVAWYTKGLIHNGSHFINLLEYWLGPVRDFRIVDPGRATGDLDCEPDVRVVFAGGDVTVLSARETPFSHHEIHLVARNGCLRYEQGGARIGWQPARPDPALDGYVVLGATREDIPSESRRLQWHVADGVAAALNGRDTDLCTAGQALGTLETVLDMKAAL